MNSKANIRRRERKENIKLLKKNWGIYLFLIPGIIFLIFFKYIPMYGIITAFQNYNIFTGILGSEWVGFAQFEKLFSSTDFYRILRNTILISCGKIIVTFPLSILLAIMLNEILQPILKKVYQTALYLPHFLSWVIVAGLVTVALSPSTGIINNIIIAFGGEPIPFLMSNAWFRIVVILTETWKEVGYSAIVFIAAITGINPELYEAARVDGASKIKQIIHITLPSMSSIIILMFVLKLGGILNANTEEILLLYNPTVYETGDVLGTYIYRTGLSDMNYSYATAVGLFESLVGMTLVFGGNFLSKRISGRSVW